MPWELEFFEDEAKDQPVRRFLDNLEAPKRAALIAALEHVLGSLGPDVCQSEYGKPLGEGLYEFRVRHSERTLLAKAGAPEDKAADTPVLLRVFFHPYGDRIVLLLGAYDKGVDPSERRQQREIRLARKRLTSFSLRRKRERAAARRR